MLEKDKKAYDEGFAAFADGLDMLDCPYDSFTRETEDQAMNWINGYRDAVAFDHDCAPR